MPPPPSLESPDAVFWRAPAMRLEGSVALVTGASSGIGRSVALLLAERGARLAVAGRDRDAVAAVAARAGALAEMPPEVAERLVAVNLLAPVRLTGLVLPGMLERGGGHLAYVGSIAGATGVAREAVYAATKAGLAAFADSVREEVAGRGVGVSVTIPGVLDTPFFERRGSAYDRAWPAPVPPERVARAILRAVGSDRAEVFAPAWMRLPARFKGALPGLYRTLALRFGQAATAPRRSSASRHR